MKKLFVALAALISFNSHAYDVTNGPLQQHPALCSYGYNPNCYNGKRQRASSPEYVPPVYIPPKYGAYAENPKTGIGGGILNQDSFAAAMQGAIRECEQGGRNKPCKIVKWVGNGCIAGAKGKQTASDKTWKTFYASDHRGLAEHSAVVLCKARNFVQCQVSLPEGCSYSG